MGKCCSTTKNTRKNENAEENQIKNTKATNTIPNNQNEQKRTEQEEKPKLTKIRFYYEGKPIEMEPKEVSETEPLNQVLDPVKNNLPILSDYYYHDKDNKQINQNEILKNIFKKEALDQVQIINVVYQGLDVPSTRENISKAYSKTSLIGNPVAESNPFELRIFDSESMELTKATFNINDHPELVTFSNFSAYCNGNNHLYLSGGETENVDPNTGKSETVYLSWVSKINLADGKLTKLDNMKVPRIWHSMIYVPNKYVFIVGGNNTTSVEILNTETGEISEDSQLNDFHSEASLCLVNQNYLYCFLGFRYDEKGDYSNTIERCNLRLKTRVWEIVNVLYQDGERTPINSKIVTRFFVTSYYDDSNIIILGGDNIYSKEIPQLEGNELKETNIDEKTETNDKPKEDNVEGDKKETTKEYLFSFADNSIKEFERSTLNFRLMENIDPATKVEKKDIKVNIESFEDLKNDVFPEKFFIPMKSSTNEKFSCLIPMQVQYKLKVYLMKGNSHMEIKEFEDDNNNESIIPESEAEKEERIEVAANELKEDRDQKKASDYND